MIDMGRTLSTSAAVAEFVVNARAALAATGKLAPVVREYCALEGCSTTAAYDMLKRHGVKTNRKTRSDKGKSKVSLADVQAVAGMQLRSKRRSEHKRSMPASRAIDLHKENGLITDASKSTYYRRAKDLHLDGESLKRPSPFVRQRALHPGDVFEMDCSQAAVWYLRKSKLVLDRARAAGEYKLEQVKQRGGVLKRYLLIDRFSTAVWGMYSYEAGESTSSYIRLLWEALTYKGEAFPLSGIPRILYTDPGPALTSAPMKNLYEALGIEHITHKPSKPGNSEHARATGAVESAMGWWEANFEDELLARGETSFSLAELNERAYQYCLKRNTTHIVERLNFRKGATPFEAWQWWANEHPEQAAERLYPPEWVVFKDLAVGKQYLRKIHLDWTINFAPERGCKNSYSLRSLRGYEECQPGKTLAFTRSMAADTPHDIVIDTVDGKRHTLAPLVVGYDGDHAKAPVIGLEHKGVPKDMATRAREAATAQPLPQRSEPGKVARLDGGDPRVAAVSEVEHMLERYVWIDTYAATWDWEPLDARRIYDQRYGDATHAPALDIGEEYVLAGEEQGEEATND